MHIQYSLNISQDTGQARPDILLSLADRLVDLRTFLKNDYNSGNPRDEVPGNCGKFSWNVHLRTVLEGMKLSVEGQS